MRKLLFVLFLPVILLLVVYAGLVGYNNRPVDAVPDQRIADSLERAIGWLMANRQRVLANENRPLWWMLQQTGRVGGDKRLLALFDEFENGFLKQNINEWYHVFYDHPRVPLLEHRLVDYEEFAVYMFYAASCHEEIADLELVLNQNRDDYCPVLMPWLPACVTHNLMGVRLLQRSECGDPAELSRRVSFLQDRIVAQLIWDPRVVDVYLQRVLMLAETGVADRIKPVWLHTVLDKQLPDGSWDSFDGRLPAGGGRYVGFTNQTFDIRKPATRFHTTVQGVYLLTLLQQAGND